jgi:Trk-type K+ transport system membrane component
MKQLRYYLFMILVILLELGITCLLYFFVTASKALYVGFALFILLGTIAYLVLSRYLERIKVKPRKEVLAGYRKVVFTTVLVIGGIFSALIIIKAASYLIRFQFLFK